jgi:hypothetical protein
MANDKTTDSPVLDTSTASVEDWVATHIIGDRFEEFNEKKPENSEEKPSEDEKEDKVKDLEPEAKEEEPEVKPDEEPEKPEETEEAKADPVQKRIDKLTAQKKSAEEEVTKLKESIAEYEKAPKKEIVLTPSPKDPLSDILSVEDLTKRSEAVERMREHCLRNPDGFSYQHEGKEVFVDAAEVREHIVDTDRLLRKDIPARQKWLDTHSQTNAEAKRVFPELFDSRTADYQTAQSMLAQLPELKRIPSYNYIIGCAIQGERLIQSKQNPKKAVAETKKVPTPPTSSAGSVANASKKVATKITSRSSQGDIEQHIMDKYLSNMKF